MITKMNMRIGPLQITKAGTTYDDLTRVLGSRSIKVDTFSTAFALLSAVRSYDEVPDTISVDADQLDTSTSSPSNLIITLQTLQQLNCEKFNSSKRHIINVTASKPISTNLASDLARCGITTIVPKISMFGFDACVDANKEALAHGGYWPSYLLSDSASLTSSIGNVPINLSKRQKEIASLIADRGLSNKQIARHCGISESAVKLHIGIVLKKYGIQNRTQIGIAMK